MVDTVKDGCAGYYITVQLEDGSLVNAFVAYTSSPGGGSAVAGPEASGVPVTSNPVGVGGRAQSTAPTAVANGQRVNAWYGLNGQQAVALVDLSGNIVFVTTSAVDGVGTANRVVGAASFNYVFNGVTWDRTRGDTAAMYAKAPPLAHTASAVVAASTTSQQLFAASTTRTRLLIQNQDAAINIFVNLGAVATAGSPSMRIAPGATLELEGTNATVNVIAASGAPAVAAWQF